MTNLVPYCDLKAGTLGYSFRSMSPPPAEKKSNVIQFSLTEGCSYATCKFCEMYDRGTYSVKTFPAFQEHVNLVLGALEFEGRFRVKDNVTIDRIFIGGGNALSVDTELLLDATQYALNEVRKFTGKIPRRLTLYGNTKDILSHDGSHGLTNLRCGGTCGACSIDRLGDRRGLELVYWGLESGNTDVLKLVGKGYTAEEAREAFKILNRSSIRSSIMVMPGLGGVAYSEPHIADTVAVLNEGRPEFITFIGLMVAPNTPYARWMEKEEERQINRRLTPTEIAEQTARIIELLSFETTVGVHGADVHTYCLNPVYVGATKLRDNADAKKLAVALRTSAFEQGLSTLDWTDVFLSE